MILRESIAANSLEGKFLFRPGQNKGKGYWNIVWHGENNETSVAIGATQVETPAVPFGIQSELKGVVAYILLINPRWNYFYCIPTDDFWGFRTTIDRKDGRKYFNVTDDKVSSAGTPYPINISSYARPW